MAEFNKAGERIISVVRVLEYKGTDNWIMRTMQASRLPMHGEFKGHDGKGLPEGCSIKSGLVVWVDEQAEEPPPVRPLIPIPPGSTSIQ